MQALLVPLLPSAGSLWTPSTTWPLQTLALSTQPAESAATAKLMYREVHAQAWSSAHQAWRQHARFRRCRGLLSAGFSFWKLGIWLHSSACHLCLLQCSSAPLCTCQASVLEALVIAKMLIACCSKAGPCTNHWLVGPIQ